MVPNIAQETGPAPAPTGAAPPHEAVIFGLDGVVTDTAGVNAAAWKIALADTQVGERPQAPFGDVDDYERHFEASVRKDAVASFPAARGSDVPHGRLGDGVEARSVRALVARQEAVYRQMLADEGMRTFPETVDLLRRLRAGGVPAGLVSAGCHTRDLLAEVGLQELFDVVVDGAQDRPVPGRRIRPCSSRLLSGPRWHPPASQWWRQRSPGHPTRRRAAPRIAFIHMADGPQPDRGAHARPRPAAR